MKAVENFVNPWVKESEPYSAKHMDVAWENPQLIRMMSNENLLEPSEGVLDAVLTAARQGNLYPGSGPELRKMLGERNGVSADQVVLGNGSTDVINFVICTFAGPGDEIIIPVPTFPMYEARAKVAGAKVIQVPMTADFYWDMDAILAAVNEKTKLIFLCSPNNPTGNQIKEADLIKILELGIPTFFDEAYYEMENEVHSRVYLIEKYPNMVVNRTFSKAFGLAGMRLGYLLCTTELAEYFNRVKIPWNVSLLTLAAAQAELEDNHDQQAKRDNVLKGRQYIYDEINKVPGLIAFPSEGNFVLINASATGKTSLEIREKMIEKGIFIRPMSGHNMPLGFIRITVGTPAQNKLFLERFNEYLSEIGYFNRRE